LHAVPDVGDLFITKSDYNRDPSIKELADTYPPKAISWRPRGALILEYPAITFQIYLKPMPFEEECLGFEGHHRKGRKKRNWRT
jgi:hypothetical protein